MHELIKKAVKNIIDIKTKQTTSDKYNKEFTQRYSEYSLGSADQSFIFINSYLESIGNTVLTERHTEEIYNAIETIYTTNLNKSDADFVREKISDFYVSVRPTEKFRKKQDARVDLDLNLTNREVGNIIGSGYSLYIQGHASDSEVAATMRRLFKTGLENQLTGANIAGLLQVELSAETPGRYKTKYGEKKYWEGVAEQHISKTRTIADIYNYDDAGILALRIYARMTERTCEICGEKHRTVVLVSDAVKQADAYIRGSMEGSVTKMNAAFPWGPDGDLPTFHFWCKCYPEPIFKDDFIVEDEIEKISDSDLNVDQKKRAYADLLQVHTNMKHEAGIVIGKGGKALAFRDGGRFNIMFSGKIKDKLKEGLSFTHTHPSNGSLSIEDAFISQLYQIEISAITETYIYKLFVKKSLDRNLLIAEFRALQRAGKNSNYIWNQLSDKYPEIRYGRSNR